MKIITTQEEFNKAKSKDLITLECEKCGGHFKREKIRVNSRDINYCSAKCGAAKRINSVIMNCANCNKEIKRQKCERERIHSNGKKQQLFFCSRHCNGYYFSQHKTWGCGRSKLEKWIEKQLGELFTNLEILYNNSAIINSELDIYIPSLKLAFELNGIFHYEPIFGKEELEKKKNNDNRKFQACIENGIELCIIDTSKQVYFKEQTSLKYLEIITNLIKLKLDQTNIKSPCNTDTN